MARLSDEDRENITAFLDGELDEETAHKLEARISLDPEMRQEFEAMKQAWNMLDYLPKVQPSESFTHRTMERLSLEGIARASETGKMPRGGGGWWWTRVAGWAAVLLVGAGVGFGAAYLLGGRGPDTSDSDESLVRHLSVLERWRLYEQVDNLDIDFVKALDQPDLFGEDPGS